MYVPVGDGVTVAVPFATVQPAGVDDVVRVGGGVTVMGTVAVAVQPQLFVTVTL